MLRSTFHSSDSMNQNFRGQFQQGLQLNSSVNAVQPQRVRERRLTRDHTPNQHIIYNQPQERRPSISGIQNRRLSRDKEPRLW